MSADESRAQAERAIVRELLAWHRQLNRSHFKGALSTPQIALSDATSILARWLRGTHTIEVARPFLQTAPSCRQSST